jgi:AcrR family transcriptional regulator
MRATGRPLDRCKQLISCVRHLLGRNVANDPPREIARARRRRASRGAGAQLRATIVDAATELLIETGNAKTVSIRSVAERAGVTSPSIYLHFADKGTLLDAVCAEYFQQLDGQMQAAAAGCTTTVEALYALGMAYVRFALKTPVLYRIATMGEPRSPSDVDIVLASSAFVHLRAAVQEMIDDGIYPPRDANRMAFELWTVIHGVAALFIAKPYWSPDDVEELTGNVLRAMYCGQIATGIVGYETPRANDLGLTGR